MSNALPQFPTKMQGDSCCQSEMWPLTVAQVEIWKSLIWSADLAVIDKSRLSADIQIFSYANLIPLADKIKSSGWDKYALFVIWAEQLLKYSAVFQWQRPNGVVHGTAFAEGNFCSYRRGFIGNQYNSQFSSLGPSVALVIILISMRNGISFFFLPRNF